jgi:hypothetical protein
MNCHDRRSLAQFRIGVAPLMVETLRYNRGGPIPFENRLCCCCDIGEVEDEVHSLIRCQFHQQTRADLFADIMKHFPDFVNMNDNEKYYFLMSEPRVSRIVARSCRLILLNRKDFLNIIK